MKPRLLDLFSGAGGAAKGYADAGFEVVGIDIQPQPNYPFEFQCGDALSSSAWARLLLEWRFDAIHASPPCQGYTGMNRRWDNTAPKLIADTRTLLEATGLPYVIENVGGAVSELRNPIQLCGRSLGLKIHRHRLFESNVPLMGVPCSGGRNPFGVYGKLDGRRLWTRQDGSELRAAKTLEEASIAMRIDWMTWDELREAIPSVMTEHIGGYLLAHLQAVNEQAA